MGACCSGGVSPNNVDCKVNEKIDSSNIKNVFVDASPKMELRSFQGRLRPLLENITKVDFRKENFSDLWNREQFGTTPEYVLAWKIVTDIMSMSGAGVRREFRAFVKQVSSVTTTRIVQGLSHILVLVLFPVFKAIETFISNQPNTQEWNDAICENFLGMIRKEREIALNSIETGSPKKLEKFEMNLLIPNICIALYSLYNDTVYVSDVLPASIFYHPLLNRCMNMTLDAAWFGDAIRGQLPKILLRDQFLQYLIKNPEDMHSEIETTESMHGKRAMYAPSYYFLCNGAAKAILIQQNLVNNTLQCNGKESTIRVNVDRATAFMDSFKHIMKLKMLQTNKAAVIFFPFFASDFSVNRYSQWHPVGKNNAAPLYEERNSQSNAIVEEGQGHGPRKELFSSLSSQLCNEWCIEKSSPDDIRASGQRGKRQITFSTNDNNHTLDSNIPISSYLKAGYLLKLTYLDSEGQEKKMEIKIERIVNDFTIDLGLVLFENIVNASFLYCTPMIKLLDYYQSSESCWPSLTISRNLDNETYYEYLGWIIGCCLINRSQLAVRISRFLFEILMCSSSKPASSLYVVNDAQINDSNNQPTKESDDLSPNSLRGFGINGVYVPSVMDVKNLSTNLYTAIVRVTDTKLMSDKEFNDLLILEGMSYMSRNEYALHIMNRVMVFDVEWQSNAMRTGFSKALGPRGLQLLKIFQICATDLQDIICGPLVIASDVNLQYYYRWVLDDDVMAHHLLIDALFSVLQQWDNKKKSAFLKFVTGVATLPAPCSENIIVELPFLTHGIEEHKKTLMMLPQSHTCVNTLELPNYLHSILALREANEKIDLPEPTFKTNSDDVILKPPTPSHSSRGPSRQKSPGTFSQPVTAHLPQREKAYIFQQLIELLDNKLSMAVENTNSYGLDTLDDISSGANARSMHLTPRTHLTTSTATGTTSPVRQDYSSIEKKLKIEATPKPTSPIFIPGGYDENEPDEEKSFNKNYYDNIIVDDAETELPVRGQNKNVERTSPKQEAVEYFMPE